MDTLVENIFAQYGSLGILVILVVYLIWVNTQNKKDRKSEGKTLNDSLLSMSDRVDGQLRNIREYIETERTVLEKSISLTETKLDLIKDNLDTRMDNIEKKLNEQPADIANSIGIREMEHKVEHNLRMISQLQLSPKLHKVLAKYRERMNLDHIFIATFHNGTESLSGIPYYKFDMIAEKFRPDKIQRDVEFCHMYKDADLMKHDRLPIILIQQGMLHYEIKDDGTSDLQNIDDIIYRRMVGRDIKQLTLHITRNKSGRPSGFVGGVKYNHDKINLDEYQYLVKEVEEIFNELN